MNIEKWTTALQTAMQKAMQRVLESSRQIVDIEDIMIALLEDSSGIMTRVFTKANIDIAELISYLNDLISLKPTVSHASEENMRISYDLNQLFIKANTIKCRTYYYGFI